MSSVENYNITFKFNGETRRKRTADVAKAIDDVRPPVLHTEMYVTVKKGKDLIERKLSLRDARRVFLGNPYREVFINNLLLQHYG